MAISTTWSVSNMTHNDSDGGVVTVYYSCVATDGTYSATETALQDNINAQINPTEASGTPW